MKLKKMIVPILMLLALLVIIDRIAMRDDSWNGSLPQKQTGNQDEGSDRNTEDISSVTYFCKEGNIEADFGPESMGLLLGPSAQSFSLPQVRSGSGIRYEKDGLEFSGKGAQAVVIKDGKEIFSDCIAGTVRALGASATGADSRFSFSDEAKTFSFSYPRDFRVVGSDMGLTEMWRQNSTAMGSLLATVVIPRSFQPKTNFSEAVFTVGMSVDPQAVATCTVPSNGEQYAVSGGKGDAPRASRSDKPTAVRINGTAFTKITFSDAAMSNYQDTVSYRTLRDGACYAVEYMIHSTNRAVYDSTQGITEFDRTRIEEIMEGIVRSFSFLKK